MTGHLPSRPSPPEPSWPQNFGSQSRRMDDLSDAGDPEPAPPAAGGIDEAGAPQLPSTKDDDSCD
eukprot:631293-Pyramimonas_sp.AAC.1